MLNIQKAMPKQFDEIWPIFRQVVQAADTYPYPPDITKEKAQALWFAPEAKVYIAYVGKKPVASRYIVPNKIGLGSHIANTGVMIDPEYRGQGLGNAMMEFALMEAKKLGFRAIQLNMVVSTNTASIRICTRHGFTIIGTVPEAFHYKQERYVDAYVMYRRLD